MMTIGQLSHESRVTPRAIRYYERLGLLPPPRRSASNYRLFDSSAVERLRFVATCRTLGFPIADIGDLLKIMDDPRHTCAQVARLAEHHVDLIDAKVHDLTEMRATLTEFLSHCTGRDVPECAMLDLLKQSDHRTR
jgi:MerR family mercuric resistance operon transcriptional regulator